MMEKTDRDIELGKEARAINESLDSSRLSVTAGGSKGPFTLSVGRLGRKQLAKVIEAVKLALETK